MFLNLKEICNNNLTSLKTLQTFMFTRKWEETEKNLVQNRYQTASSHMHCLIDNFEAYFPSQQATDLQWKLCMLNLFSEQHTLWHLGTNFKNDLCQEAFVAVENTQNSG